MTKQGSGKTYSLDELISGFDPEEVAKAKAEWDAKSPEEQEQIMRSMCVGIPANDGR